MTSTSFDGSFSPSSSVPAHAAWPDESTAPYLQQIEPACVDPSSDAQKTLEKTLLDKVKNLPSIDNPRAMQEFASNVKAYGMQVAHKTYMTDDDLTTIGTHVLNAAMRGAAFSPDLSPEQKLQLRAEMSKARDAIQQADKAALQNTCPSSSLKTPAIYAKLEQAASRLEAMGKPVRDAAEELRKLKFDNDETGKKTDASPPTQWVNAAQKYETALKTHLNEAQQTHALGASHLAKLSSFITLISNDVTMLSYRTGKFNDHVRFLLSHIAQGPQHLRPATGQPMQLR